MAPLRIACFHSFRMSGGNLRKQMCEFSNFASSLGEQCEFRFIDGPHRCPPEKEAQMPGRPLPLLRRTPCRCRALRGCACLRRWAARMVMHRQQAPTAGTDSRPE